MSNLFGSICLTDIPRELIKEVTLKDGTKKKYLNISIWERKQPTEFGQTHNVSCMPKKEERKDGVNYYIGQLKPIVVSSPSIEDIENSPSAPIDDLPF